MKKLFLAHHSTLFLLFSTSTQSILDTMSFLKSVLSPNSEKLAWLDTLSFDELTLLLKEYELYWPGNM